MKFKLTDLGKWMEAQLMAGSKPIITKIEASDAYSSNEGALLSVQNKKQDLEIQEIAVIDGASHLKFVLHNVGLPEGYMLRQIGIYAKQTEESEEILYIIGQDKTGERVPASNEKQVEYEYDLMIHTENTYEANVVVKGSYFATKGEMKELDGKKVDASGGNISDTKVSEFETREDVFPEPEEGDTQKTLWGKIKKFVEDFRDWYTGVCLIGHIVNNCTSNASNLPLSAAQGKVLMDLCTKLNSDFRNYGFPITSPAPDDLRNIDHTCFFVYNMGTLNNPMRDRGGLGINVYLNENRQTIIAIPYNSTNLYVSTKYNGSWSDWDGNIGMAFNAFQADVNTDIVIHNAWICTYGKIVTFMYTSNVKNIAVGSNVFGTIPEKLRPYSGCYVRPSTSQDLQYQICFDTDGTIELYNYTKEDHIDIHWCRFCATWIAR